MFYKKLILSAVLTLCFSTTSFAKDTILFIGSSSIAKWKSLDHDFSDFKAINKGRSGSKYSYVKAKAGNLTKRYNPDHIVFYSGDNDISLLLGGGISLEKIIENFKQAVRSVRKVAPSVPIYVISVKPTKSRPIKKAKALNKLLEASTTNFRDVYYIDVFSQMVNGKGSAPKKNLLSIDGIHMNKSGYEIWTDSIKRKLR